LLGQCFYNISWGNQGWIVNVKVLKGKYHEMTCQLRPLVYSLGLNNPPRICLTPRKSCVKNLWPNKQGNCQCKMAGAGIWSFAKFCGQIPRIATTGLASWQTALKWTADYQVPRSGCLGQVKHVAIRSHIHTSVCGNPCDGYSILGNPHSKRRGLPQSVAHIWAQELGKRLNSSSRHFTSGVPLFEASYLFAARLLEYKIPTSRIV
jgi:hypothetical protein